MFDLSCGGSGFLSSSLHVPFGLPCPHHKRQLDPSIRFCTTPGSSGVARIWARRGTKRHAYNLSHAREITQNTATLCYKTIRCALSFFTARGYASAVLAMGLCLSVSLSVCLCLSVTSRSSTKKAKRRITQITPHDSPGPLVF